MVIFVSQNYALQFQARYNSANLVIHIFVLTNNYKPVYSIPTLKH